MNIYTLAMERSMIFWKISKFFFAHYEDRASSATRFLSFSKEKIVHSITECGIRQVSHSNERRNSTLAAHILLTETLP